MKNMRQTYYLNITEPQMKEIQLLVKQERQKLTAESPTRTPQVARLKGLEEALNNSVYFFNKHKIQT